MIKIHVGGRFMEKRKENRFMEAELPLGTALNPGVMIINERQMDAVGERLTPEPILPNATHERPSPFSEHS
jgi:hypothetical protein